MHDMRVGIFRRRARLRYRARILREMDRAIMREGGIHNLPTDALRKACFIRGKNEIPFCNCKQKLYSVFFVQDSIHQI